jgi:hypothetical protein
MNKSEEFEAKFADMKSNFLQLYNIFEGLDKDISLITDFRDLSILEIEQKVKESPNSYKIKKAVKNKQEEYDYLILTLSVVLKFFVVLGPGKGDKAWNVVKTYYQHYLESGETDE